MTRQEQRQFVRELVANVRADVLNQLPLFPDTWDGHEIRQYLADKFQESSWTLKEDRARYRAYKNALLVMGRR